MPIPDIEIPWGGYRLRHGEVKDADTVEVWSASAAYDAAALGNVASRLRRAEDAFGYIVEQLEPLEPVGLLTLTPPFLNFAFVLESSRRNGLAKRATVILVDRYFRTSTESKLTAGQPISTNGSRLLACLYFDGVELSRAHWEHHRASFERLFADD